MIVKIQILVGEIPANKTDRWTKSGWKRCWNIIKERAIHDDGTANLNIWLSCFIEANWVVIFQAFVFLLKEDRVVEEVEVDMIVHEMTSECEVWII